MSCRRTGLWLVIGACALGCAAEERNFGATDAAVKGDDEGDKDEQASETGDDAEAPTTVEAGGGSGVDASRNDDTGSDPTETSADDDSEDDEPTTKDDSSEPGTEVDDDDLPTDSETMDPTSEPDDAGSDPTETTEPGPAEDASTPACTKDAHCDDLNPCNGQETCAEGECQLGSWPQNGEQCELGDDAAMRVCSEGNCVLSICGDGYTDARKDEKCDDANGENADGCTVSCAYSCTGDEQCDDTQMCNGVETCDPELHYCVEGEWVDDQTECGDTLICHNGGCVPEGCGNGAVEAGEECDDNNLDAGDGCEADCTFTCVEDAQCDDASVCTGTETCDPELHVCLPGENLECVPPDDCTSSACDAVSGCYYPLIDGDGDGQASSAYECGTDCDDEDNTVYSGAAELCDDKDNNCNDSTDETAPTWYPDCDGDGFAPNNAAGTQQCNAPDQPPAECAGRGLVGAWTATAPASGNADCWDDSASVHPMNSTENGSAWSQYSIEGRPVSVDYDYNCDDEEEPLYTYQATTCTSGAVFEPAAGGVITPPIAIQPCYGDGWSGSAVPDCEDTAAWKDCKRVDGNCAFVTIQMHQQCR